MKKIFTVVAMAILMLGSFSAKAQAEKFPPIDIKFGYAAGPFGCVGWSLCQITIGKSSKMNLTSNSARGKLTKTKNGKLEMYIQYNKMDKTSKKNLFLDKKTFKIEEDFYLSSEVLESLGLSKKQQVIKKGIYKITHVKDGVKIIF